MKKIDGDDEHCKFESDIILPIYMNAKCRTAVYTKINLKEICMVKIFTIEILFEN